MIAPPSLWELVSALVRGELAGPPERFTPTRYMARGGVELVQLSTGRWLVLTPATHATLADALEANGLTQADLLPHPAR
jgi:hypothetical protein